MIQTCFTIIVIFVCSIGIAYFIKWCHDLHYLFNEKIKVLDDLERCMDRNNILGVRSLLEVRGHLLPKQVFNNAKVWLVEHS